MGCVAISAAASTSLAAALNSPSAWMILARRSRSASACLAMARSMFFGHVDLLDLDRDDLEAKGRGVAVDDDLNALVEAVAVGQQLVEIDLAEHRAQRGLRELRGLVDVVGDLDDRLDGHRPRA